MQPSPKALAGRAFTPTSRGSNPFWQYLPLMLPVMGIDRSQLRLLADQIAEIDARVTQDRTITLNCSSSKVIKSVAQNHLS
jgi:hypothetical protein